jgi:hypothetical protein
MLMLQSNGIFEKKRRQIRSPNKPSSFTYAIWLSTGNDTYELNAVAMAKRS